MQYLTVDDVARINAWFVGEDLPFDFGLLESAVLRPQTTVGGVDAYPTIHDKTAALPAVSAVYVFYRLNGWRLVLEDGDLVALAVDVAEGILPVDTIAKRLAQGTHEDELPDEPSDDSTD